MANDSQLPALISETLPAVLTDDLPDKPADFDGWTAKKINKWIGQWGELGRYEALLEPARLAVGLALHFLRDRVDEGVYGRDVARLAEQIGVHEGTLRRWRAQAERHYGLEPPERAAKRAEAARQAAAKAAADKLRALARSPQGQAIETTAEEIPNTHLSGLEPDMPTAPALPAAPNAPAPPSPPSPVDEDKTVGDLVHALLPLKPAVLSQAAKRSELVKLEGLAKQAQQANADDGSRLALLAPDVVSRLAVSPTEPFDAGVNRVIRDLLAKVERASEAAPMPPASPPPPAAATKVKPAAVKKTAPKPKAVKRPKKGEPCPHPREAHVGVDLRGVTCSWCDAKALTHVSLERMGQAAVTAR